MYHACIATGSGKGAMYTDWLSAFDVALNVHQVSCNPASSLHGPCPCNKAGQTATTTCIVVQQLVVFLCLRDDSIVCHTSIHPITHLVQAEITVCSTLYTVY